MKENPNHVKITLRQFTGLLLPIPSHVAKPMGCRKGDVYEISQEDNGTIIYRLVEKAPDKK